VRLSGAAAFTVLAQVFRAEGGRPVPDWPTHTVHHGWVLTPEGEPLDEVLSTVMRAPKTYTAEDVVEISCHGGPAVARAVLERCLKSGARLAEPGEFTKRAFLNGRMDLAQAEAVLDVISAKTDAALRLGVHQLKGDLSKGLESIRQELLEAFAGIEALLNFPEEDTNSDQGGRVLAVLTKALAEIDELLATAHSGRVLIEGIRVVICGKPNVGKSSLLNALLKEPRAIVTDLAGTTRDVLEETANIRGIPVRLIDTAGILKPRDRVEEEAVKRAHASIESADVVLLVVDRSQPLEDDDLRLIASIKAPHAFIVANKRDLPLKFDISRLTDLAPSLPLVNVSALTKEGLAELQDQVAQLALGGKVPDGRGVVVHSLRHQEALQRGREALARAVSSVEDKTSLEFVSEDIKTAVNALDAITGRNVDADVIDEIFSRFCIGK
jgi:tRNA modification GTPase